MNFRSRDREELDVNLTPLIDVVFLLLIFFMITTTFNKDSQLKIALPKASENVAEQQQQTIEISINAEGHFFLNQQEVISMEAGVLMHSMRKISKGRKDWLIVIRADGASPHQSLITALDVSAQLGLTKISFATQGQTSDKGGK